jgi:hypothetical protein
MKAIKLLRKRLDDRELAAHLEALAAGAKDIEIRIKGAVAGYSDATTETLEVVGRRLRAGEIAAVQIRFFQDDDWWSDTVMRAADGFRLVRMRQEDPTAA